MKVLLPTLGSSGDVHPFIALGVALRARGHQATILTNPYFQTLVERQGLDFLPVGNIAEVERAVGNPDLWHLRKGFDIIARVLEPAMAQIYGLLESHADASTVVAFSTLAFGARVAQEKLGIPSASVHLQPSVIRTFADQGMLGNVRMSAAQPAWLKRALFRAIDWLVLDRSLMPPLNRLRTRLGLPPVDRVMHRWMHSPQLVIAFFPDWFAAPQPDWPANTHTVGFPLWDGDGESASAQEAEAFLSSGAPPVIFTPGSAGSTMQSFFRESVRAVGRVGLRAMLVTNFPQQVPASLPRDVRVFGYLPFSALLPRAALLVYHGGIGTLAQGIRAAVPHLVVPHGYDQFDSGWRIEQLRLGRSIPQSRYRAESAAGAIRSILQDASASQRRVRFAERMDPAAALSRACDLLEGLAARK